MINKTSFYPEDETLKGIMKMLKENPKLFNYLCETYGHDDTEAQKENK